MVRSMIIAAALAIVAWPAAARAHAVVVEARPAVDTIVPVGGLDIRLQFNSRIDAQRSRLTLQNPDRQAVAVMPAIAEPNVLAARSRIDRQGRWTLRWQVLSRDGHITRGEIPFIAGTR